MKSGSAQSWDVGARGARRRGLSAPVLLRTSACAALVLAVLWANAIGARDIRGAAAAGHGQPFGIVVLGLGSVLGGGFSGRRRRGSAAQSSEREELALLADGNPNP